MTFKFRNVHSNSDFYRHKIIKLPHKILMENCLIIRKSIQLNLPIIDSLQFPIIGSLFLLTHNYETFSSSKGLLKLKSVNSKKYGTEAKINNTISSWNDIQKTISSHVLCDLSSSKLKSLLGKHFLET